MRNLSNSEPVYMLREGDVGFAETVVEAITQHRVGSLGGFFGRLRDGQQRASPLVPGACEDLQRRDKAGDMEIMAAGMHHRNLLTVGSNGSFLASVAKPGLLIHW
jgi:hypothetical protein